MAEVIEPRAFNQRFTLYLNSEGKPVERSLREMTAGEVWEAIRFQIGESNRLEAEAMPWQPAEGESEEAYRERMSGDRTWAPSWRCCAAPLKRHSAPLI
jgi:hypothetical protein